VEICPRSTVLFARRAARKHLFEAADHSDSLKKSKAVGSTPVWQITSMKNPMAVHLRRFRTAEVVITSSLLHPKVGPFVGVIGLPV